MFKPTTTTLCVRDNLIHKIEENKRLFGLITFKKKLSTKKIGKDLIIETNGEDIDKVFLDGKVLSK